MATDSAKYPFKSTYGLNGPDDVWFRESDSSVLI